MIPNKTEAQILYQQFKYFDLDSTGFCTLQNFIRVQNRIGVVLPKVKDFEKIFNYFSEQETSLLNYKKFCDVIFKLEELEQQNNEEENDNDDYNVYNDKDFITILINKLIEGGGAMTLLEMVKNMQIIDFEGNKRLNSDEFLTSLKRSGIKLEHNEIQKLFLSQDFFINGIVKYQILVDILLSRFWDEKKNELSEEIFFILTNEGRKLITLNEMKNIFDKIIEDPTEKKYLMNFIDRFKLINKNRINQNLILTDFIKFLKFYNFGENSKSFLDNLIAALDPNRINNFTQPSLNNKKLQKKQEKINRYKLKKENQNFGLNDIFETIRKKISNYSRKTFFNFIKHFKYYDNNSDFMSKYNFSKVFKDFNISIDMDEFQKIFDFYEISNNDHNINYKKFINDLISNFTSKKREKIIKYIYSTIEERGKKFNREIDINFLKDVYNARKNYFKKEESDNRLEYEDCLELYNYIYKGNKTEIFNIDYFIEFYKCISFLIQEDEDFYNLISNEWRVPLEYIENELADIKEEGEEEEKEVEENNNIINDNYNYTISNKEIKAKENEVNKKNLYTNINDEKSLKLLENILRNRGLRGILYLHLEFINSCKDLAKITLQDLINVFEIQHINLSQKDTINIFNQFNFKNNKNYLNFSAFMRNYKKELSENKLPIVEQAFSNIDINENDKVPSNFVKKQFKAKNHPKVLNGQIKEEDIILEFLDCFNINYEILNLDTKIKNEESERFIDFEIFANFYEYVAFIYPDDDEFEKVVNSAWN